MQEVTNLISSVGFPIAACIALFYQLNKTTQSHREEISELRQVVENNTLTLQKMIDKMEEK